MKTLQECKDEIARSYGANNWVEFVTEMAAQYRSTTLNQCCDEAAELCASQFQPPVKTMKTAEHHFVLKEDGKIYWIEKMPHDLMWQNASIDYNTALQSAIDNAVEVSNQEEVEKALCDRVIVLVTNFVYSLQCSVEIRETPANRDGKLVALVSFQPPVEEGEKREGEWILSREKMPDFDGMYYVYGFMHHECGNVVPFHKIVECRMNEWVKSDVGEQMTYWRPLLKEPISKDYELQVKEVSKEGEKGYCTTEEILLIDLFRPFYTIAGDACRRGHNLNGKKMSVSDVYKLLSDLRSEIEKNYTITRKP